MHSGSLHSLCKPMGAPILHCFLTVADYGLFKITRLETDFTLTPSQVLSPTISPMSLYGLISQLVLRHNFSLWLMQKLHMDVILICLHTFVPLEWFSDAHLDGKKLLGPFKEDVPIDWKWNWNRTWGFPAHRGWLLWKTLFTLEGEPEAGVFLQPIVPFVLRPSLGNHSQRAVVIPQFRAKLVNLPPPLVPSSYCLSPPPLFFLLHFLHIGNFPAPSERTSDCAPHTYRHIHTPPISPV